MSESNALFESEFPFSLYQRGQMLEGPKDDELQRLTEFASHVLEARVALLAMVGRDWRFFLDEGGPFEGITVAGQAPLVYTFCQYVITCGEAYVVGDARLDPPVCKLPPEDLGVLAYAGMPLVTSGGQILGSLTAFDVKARRWPPEDLLLLRDLAAQITTELNLRTKTEELGAAIRTSIRDDKERLINARLTVHDLRTPLTGLLLALEMLPTVGALNIEQTKMISVCVRTGSVLQKLVNDLLQIHELAHGKTLGLQRTLVEPSRLAFQALELVGALAKQNAVELVPPALGALGDVYVDEEKFTRVLVNLVANGIKFTPKGGQVSVSMSRIDDHAGTAVIFTVRDTGVGIQTSDARRIFDEGVRLNESASTRESTGLGLTYCKRMTEAHGGAIWCDSVLGKGSAFFVRIPCSQFSDEPTP